MRKEQFEQLEQAMQAPKMLKVSDLQDQTPRTLVYGYDTARNTFHLYLDNDQQLVRVLYNPDNICLQVTRGTEIAAEDCIPNKRVAPECCDLQVCQLLVGMNVALPFTSFSEIEPAIWHGKREKDLLDSSVLDQVTSKFEFLLEDLGLNEDEFRRFARDDNLNDLWSTINGQIEGYLKAISIYKKSPDEAKRWITNIESGIQRKLTTAKEMGQFMGDMPTPEVFLAFLGKCQAYADEKIGSITAAPLKKRKIA